jgi:hypothetical protein
MDECLDECLDILGDDGDNLGDDERLFIGDEPNGRLNVPLLNLGDVGICLISPFGSRLKRIGGMCLCRLINSSSVLRRLPSRDFFNSLTIFIRLKKFYI